VWIGIETLIELGLKWKLLVFVFVFDERGKGTVGGLIDFVGHGGGLRIPSHVEHNTYIGLVLLLFTAKINELVCAMS
jgi:hypothetical protein